MIFFRSFWSNDKHLNNLLNRIRMCSSYLRKTITKNENWNFSIRYSTNSVERFNVRIVFAFCTLLLQRFGIYLLYFHQTHKCMYVHVAILLLRQKKNKKERKKNKIKHILIVSKYIWKYARNIFIDPRVI